MWVSFAVGRRRVPTVKNKGYFNGFHGVAPPYPRGWFCPWQTLPHIRKSSLQLENRSAGCFRDAAKPTKGRQPVPRAAASSAGMAAQRHANRRNTPPEGKKSSLHDAEAVQAPFNPL
ncbi:hypothetical protein [Kingella denitrificans]